MLYADGERMVLGHSVVELIGRAAGEHSALEQLRDAARRLDRFHIPTRYPNGLPGGAPFESFVRRDLEQALELARGIVDAAAAIIEG